MNGLQKVIKYCALAFATFLSVTIIGSILVVLFSLATNLNFTLDGSVERKTISESYSMDMVRSKGIESLDVDCSADIIIVPGTELSIYAENVTEDYEISLSGGVFRIRNTSSFNFFLRLPFLFVDDSEKAKVTITVPEEFIAKRLTVESGSGQVSIEGVEADKIDIDSGSGRLIGKSLKADTFYLDCGSGSIELQGLSATKTEIKGGSGSISVEDGDLGRLKASSGSGHFVLKAVTAYDVKLESGSGNLTYTGTLTGDCSVDSGSGLVNMELSGKASDYRVSIDSGSGDFFMNGKRMNDGKYGEEKAGSIEFETGSGDVNIGFAE